MNKYTICIGQVLTAIDLDPWAAGFLTVGNEYIVTRIDKRNPPAETLITVQGINQRFWAKRFKVAPMQSVSDVISKTSIRNTNVGKSNYAQHKIQPWDIWLEYDLNPWDADIVKRTLRTKESAGMTPTEQRILDYKKIKHICDERIRQLET